MQVLLPNASPMIITPMQMYHYLSGADFPLTKSNVIHVAENNGAPEHILSMLDEIQDMEYRNLMELMEEIEVIEPEVVI